MLRLGHLGLLPGRSGFCPGFVSVFYLLRARYRTIKGLITSLASIHLEYPPPFSKVIAGADTDKDEPRPDLLYIQRNDQGNDWVYVRDEEEGL